MTSLYSGAFKAHIYNWSLPIWAFLGLHLLLIIPCVNKIRRLRFSYSYIFWLAVFLFLPVIGPIFFLGFCKPPPVQPIENQVKPFFDSDPR